MQHKIRNHFDNNEMLESSILLNFLKLIEPSKSYTWCSLKLNAQKEMNSSTGVKTLAVKIQIKQAEVDYTLKFSSAFRCGLRT